MPCGLIVGHGAEGTVGGKGVLGQVVGADGHEVGHVSHLVGHQGDRRHFGHRAHELQTEALAELDEVVGLMLVGDHRGHDPQVRVGCGVGGGERLELAFEHVHVGAQGTQATQAEGRVRLVFRSQERQRLVGAGVEHADHDLLARELAEQLGVGLGLLFDARRLGVADEQEFGTEQANAFGAVFQRLRGVGRLADVGEQRNQVAVLGGARLATQFLGCGGTGLGGFGGGDLVFARVHHDLTLGCVDDDVGAVLKFGGFGGGDDRDDATGARQNGGVGGRTALGGDDGQGLAHVERGGVGRGQVFGDEHERGFADRQSRSGSAHEVGDHALADVMQVGCTLGLVAADGAEHVFDRAEAFQHGALGGLALVDEVLDGLRKGRIGGEHGDGLQDRGGLLGAFVAVGGLFGATVQVGVDEGERLFDAGDFGFRGDVFGARSVRRFRQRSGHANDRADCDATTDTNTLNVHENSFSCFLGKKYGYANDCRIMPALHR